MADRKDTLPEEAQACPFCKAQPHCTHGYKPCPKCTEHAQKWGIWPDECNHRYKAVPINRLFCPTEDCPAHFISGLGCYSNINAIVHGPWEQAFKDACAFWNKYLTPKSL